MKFEKQPPKRKVSDLSAYDFSLVVYNLREALTASRQYFDELGSDLAESITNKALSAAHADGAESERRYVRARLEEAVSRDIPLEELVEFVFGEDW